MINELSTISERLSAPDPSARTEARYALHALCAGLDQLREQKAATDAAAADSDKPVTTAGRHEFAFPNAEDGRELSLDEKAGYLLSNFDRISIVDYVQQGLILGAQRMDARRQEKGLEPIHAATVSGLLTSEQAQSAFLAGRDAIADENNRSLRRISMQSYASRIARHLDPSLVNATILLDAVGFSEGARGMTQKPAILSPSFTETVKRMGWPPKLVAMTSAIGMHHAAIRCARQLVNPGLRTETPQVKDGMEEAFWGRKIYGNDSGEGTLYYLGYLDKSRGILRRALQTEWREDYARNRQVLTSALLMRINAIPESERQQVKTQVRRPILFLIKEGHFETAFQQLQDAARQYPQMFSRLGRQRLLGAEARGLESAGGKPEAETSDFADDSDEK